MNVALRSPVPVDVHERILDAAERLGCELGVAGLTVRHIAACAGIGTGTLYQHFESKAALLGEIRRRVHGELEAALAAVAGDEASGEALHRMCVAYLEFGERAPWRYAVAFGSVEAAPAATGTLALGPPASFHERAAACLAALELPAGDDPARVALALWVAIHGLTTARVRRESAASSSAVAEDQRFVHGYLRMLLRGVGASAARAARDGR